MVAPGDILVSRKGSMSHFVSAQSTIDWVNKKVTGAYNGTIAIKVEN